jgi:excisionase family DNA binding protein
MPRAYSAIAPGGVRRDGAAPPGACRGNLLGCGATAGNAHPAPSNALDAESNRWPGNHESQWEYLVSAKSTAKADFVSIADAAAYLGVTVRTVRNMLYDNRLRAYKLGPRIVRIRLSDIDAALTPYTEAASA